ncbi:MAG: LVIVD repeat-containing protein [Thermoplasmatota archaeon]
MRNWTFFLVAAFLTLGLSGCVDESSEPAAGNEPEPTQPEIDAYALPDTVTGFNYVGLGDPNATSGLWLHGNYAYLSGGVGLRIVDISDPTNPVLVASDIEGTTGSRDVDILEHPNGRLYAALAHGGARMTLVDVTDPTFPLVVSEVTNIGAAHNLAVVPNTTIVYNSISINTNVAGDVGTLGKIDIIDFADPENPVVKEFWFPAAITTPGGVPKVVVSTTCHDITFHAGRELAYCAGVTDTQIWSISDPWNPEIIQVIDWPLVNIHHAVWATQDGDMLILGDEIAGVAAPVPGCGNSMPTSALWFIDVSNLEVPTPVGYYQVSHDAISASVEAGGPQYCSTHFGTLVEDRPLLVMGHYTAGTSLVDFSDPANAVEVDLYTAAGTNTWEARYHNGHVYTGDTGRGMEILRIV